MRISKPAKNMLKFLPVLAVLAATVMGLFIGKDVSRTSLDSQDRIPTQSLIEPDNPQLLPFPGIGSHCFYPNIYTSLPPKCRTSDGEFIPVPGTSNILVIPAGK